MDETKTKKLPKIKILNTLLIITFIILTLNILTSKSDTLFQIIGYRTYTVLSGSMEPKYYPGDLVITKHKDKTDIQLNDIVTFKNSEGTIITHRIIEKTPEGYITQGDNNNTPDTETLTQDKIIGEVKLGIPKLGYLQSFLSKPIVIAVEMVLLAGFIVIYYKDDEGDNE